MTDSKPWRRDAWWWALKYGAIATALAFFYLRRRYHDPALTSGDLLKVQVGWALGFGAFATIAIFLARTSGMLLDLDELEAGGRGGLRLRRPERPNSGQQSGSADEGSPPGAA